MGTGYNPLDELMSYYKFNYISYLVLLLIILVNTIRAYNSYKKIKNKGIEVNYNVFDLSVSIIAFVGIISVVYFHGVISDITEKYNGSWLKYDAVIVFISAFLLGVQTLVFLKSNKENRLIK